MEENQSQLQFTHQSLLLFVTKPECSVVLRSQDRKIFWITKPADGRKAHCQSDNNNYRHYALNETKVRDLSEDALNARVKL